MYLSIGDMIGMTICLAVVLFMLVMLFASNYMLLKENRFLKGRLRAWRRTCRNHVEIPAPFNGKRYEGPTNWVKEQEANE